MQPRSASLKDTRAYIYLKLGEFNKAFSEYRSIRNDLSGSPYYELGLGLAYVGLDDPDKALDPLDDGLQEAKKIENPNPQLADLMAMAAEAQDNL